MKSYVINKNDAGQRLDKFISKAVPALPKNLMYKYIRLKRIKLNKKRCEISDRLCEGDVLELYINDEFFETSDSRGETEFLKVSDKINVIYEDENILLVNKPCVLPVISSISHKDSSPQVFKTLYPVTMLFEPRTSWS